MRISSIDIGSNAIRQIIVEVTPQMTWKTLKKERFPIRLGQDVFSSGSIKPETYVLLENAFQAFKRNNRKFRADRVAVVATSAMRDAKNAKSIISKVKKKTGLKIQTISGHVEADLIQKAIFSTAILSQDKYLFLDIGGGSAEFTFVRINPATYAFKRIFSRSFPLGVVRLKQAAETRSQAKQNVVIETSNKYFKLIPKTIKNGSWPMMIGTGGNFDALAKLKLQLLKATPNTNLTLKELQQIQKIWNKLSDQQRLELNIRKDRIDVLAHAMTLIAFSMKTFKSNKVKIPYTGLKEGVIRHLLEPEHLRSSQI